MCVCKTEQQWRSTMFSLTRYLNRSRDRTRLKWYARLREIGTKTPKQTAKIFKSRDPVAKIQSQNLTDYICIRTAHVSMVLLLATKIISCCFYPNQRGKFCKSKQLHGLRNSKQSTDWWLPDKPQCIFMSPDRNKNFQKKCIQ